METKTARTRYQNRINNAQGHFFENFIKGACLYYKQKGIAKIEKQPEPFRVMKKEKDGTATVRFTAHAEPDFIGTLAGGHTIAFEAKRTLTDRIKQDVITQTQWQSLDDYAALGACAGVCVGIGSVNAFVPWEVWRNMKLIYGRKYMTVEDIEPFRVQYNGSILFLDYVNKENAKAAVGAVKEMIKPFES